MIEENIYPPDLRPWKPVSTVPPEEWMALFRELEFTTRGTPRQYILDAKYDAQSVGDQLCEWGLPWHVVMAGYLWEYSEEQIRQIHLEGVELILSHIKESITYANYIETENLRPLLVPPYNDMGALLVAVAIYYRTLSILQKRSNGHPYSGIIQVQIQSIGRTLLHIAKRLGMWHFKRIIEDLTEQLCNPVRFAHNHKEHTRILEEYKPKLDELRQALITHYQETTGRPIMISYTVCGIAGLERRRQDAHTTATSQKTQLTGFDLVTFDIAVPTVQECYIAFGAFSQLGYILDRVTDQIANPKPNGYSHIALGLILKTHEKPLRHLKWMENGTYTCQIQIATYTMQDIMRYGCLHPTCYSLYMSSPHQERQGQFSSRQLWESHEGKILFTIQESFANGDAQLNSHTPIIVYTKERTPIALPKGATALDFAYTIDSSLGERAVDTIINNRKAPLNRILDAGDIVEVRASNEIQVQFDWLDGKYAITPQAQHLIGEALKRRYTDRRGYEQIRRELKRSGYHIGTEALNKELLELVQRYSLGTVRAYLEQLDTQSGPPHTTEWAVQKITQHIAAQNEQSSPNDASWLPVLDIQSLQYMRSQPRLCGHCEPTYPRDTRILGRIRKKTGEIVVHRADCIYLHSHATEHLSHPLPMKWQQPPPLYKIGFYIEAQDRPALALDIMKKLRRHRCMLLAFKGEAILKLRKAELDFQIETYDDKEVLDIWQELYQIPGITLVEINATITPNAVYEHFQKLRAQHTTLSVRTEIAPIWEETIKTLGKRNIILNNSFDISRPARAKMFFGRSSESRLMQRVLCDEERGQALILYGPRRSGKSSLCRNFLERYIQPPFWHVFFSLQNATHQNEASILMQLADEICRCFNEQLHQSPRISWDNLDGEPQARFKRTLHSCITRVPHARLVLILDEFGGALQSYEKHILEERFFTFWKELMDEFPQLSLVLVLPSSSHTLLSSPQFSNAFSFANYLPIQFLDRESAERLLVDPLKEQQVIVHPTTVARATTLTGGNPYYMTLIGHHLINHLNQEPHKQKVTNEDLHVVVEQLIEAGSNQNFEFHNQELQNAYEFRILEGIVELTNHAKQATVSMKKLAGWMEVSSKAIRPHLERLRNGLILEEYVSSSANPYYAFKIELVKRWMTRNRWFFSFYI